MRVRLAIVPALFLLFPAVLAAAASPAWGAPGAVIAQGGDETPGEGQETEGQSDAETDPGSGAEATPEPGPLWTYQMSKLTLLGLLPLLLVTGLLYYRFVVVRARGES